MSQFFYTPVLNCSPYPERIVLFWYSVAGTSKAGGSGVASPTILSRYANIAMFLNYQHNQFLKK
jgi:hypothetical protein